MSRFDPFGPRPEDPRAKAPHPGAPRLEDPRPEDLLPGDLDAVVRESEETLRRLGDVVGELGAVTGEGTGAGGLARALVDGAGQIREITLEPRVMRLDSQAVAEAVTEAVRAAQQDARRANEELIRAATGGEPVALDMDEARRRFEEIGDDFARALDELRRD
ncbi:YbaB/EbfC family nucleoid-associated protein [Streptosporangium sp. NPDC023615]|uniref:YbaB/EbfC family nucleoid-associated protein n=1 Tax=Streptosporangium sp. NPDC023615 TaxID=3154794 RepID=UPI003434FDA7